MVADSGMAVAAGEPIAVVGVGCRLPGGVRDLRSLGRLVTGGTNVFTPVPPDRWPAGLCDPGRGPGTVTNHVGAFLPDVARFDESYFGVTPREAGYLDPQQRMMLEVAWEAMTDSGRPRDSWRGSRTGVFVGLLAGDYNLLHA